MAAFRRDPFSLMTFHRVLISVATLGAIFYGIWEIYRNHAVDPTGAIMRAAVAFLVAIGFVIYLLRIRGRK